MSIVDPLDPSRSCPACGGRHHRSLGACPLAAWGQSPEVLELNALAGPLFRCQTCDLLFRDPMPDTAALTRAYRSIPVGSWSYEQPAHWSLSRDAINRLAPNREVLDVGCFRGDFLEYLGPGFSRYGIEPNPAGATVARERGIEIIGESVEGDFSIHAGRFGAIVMMDVIEHVARPRDVLRKLRQLLAPHGLLILFTGDACTWPVRISLPFHWYMKFPIHLVQLGNRHMRWLERDLGLERCAWRTAAHAPGTWHERIRTDGRCVASALWQRFLKHHAATRWLRHCPGFRGVSKYTEPAFWPTLRDHFWCVLRPHRA